ncbi:MAG: hypothetical protein IK062_01080 [Selenomonadaceae bacterium]|nr:hypothetical protein [Selenomonadaceae bacterium]
MAKKTPPPKIVELPKRKPKKILWSDEWLELAGLCQEMALHARDVEILDYKATQAKNEKADKYFHSCFNDFSTALKLRNAQQEIFFDKLKEIFG